MTLRFHCTFCNIVLLPVATLTSDSFVPLLISITQILIPKEAKFYTLVSKWCFFLKTAKKPSLVTLMEIQIRLTHDSFFFSLHDVKFPKCCLLLLFCHLGNRLRWLGRQKWKLMNKLTSLHKHYTTVPSIFKVGFEAHFKAILCPCGTF